MEIFSIITGVIMAIGALAGIAVGVIKLINSDNNDRNEVPTHRGYNNAHNQMTHAQLYAACHNIPTIEPMVLPTIDPIRQQRIADNNRQYLPMPITTNDVPVFHNIDPVYAPNMNNMAYMPISSTYMMHTPQPMMFHPTPQYTPTPTPPSIPMSANAMSDMCDVLNHIHHGPMPEDIIDTVLATVERKPERYGNVPGI